MQLEVGRRASALPVTASRKESVGGTEVTIFVIGWMVAILLVFSIIKVGE